MSNRLEGLSGRGGRKFAPNAVGRRSKEDRDATAPAIKPEPVEKTPKPEPRRKPGRREVRITMPAPVPLPAARGSGGGRGGGFSTGRGGFGGGSGGGRGAGRDPMIDSISGQNGMGSLRIDVADAENAPEFFPVQVPKTKVEEQADAELDALAEITPQLELKENELYLLSMSSLGLPSVSAESNPEDLTEDAMDVEPPMLPEGQMGTLRYHANGRISMKIGNTIVDLAPGALSGSVEDVMYVNTADETATLLGHVKDRLVVLPVLGKTTSTWQGEDQ